MKKCKLVVLSTLVCLMLFCVSAYAASSATVTLKKSQRTKESRIVGLSKKAKVNVECYKTSSNKKVCLMAELSACWEGYPIFTRERMVFVGVGKKVQFIERMSQPSDYYLTLTASDKQKNAKGTVRAV